jgi:putative addiction module component (TIGR02574 family)
MANVFNEIESSALKLSEKQRARLATNLLNSLEKRGKIDVEQDWLKEIDRRNRQLESEDVDLIPATEVFQKARNLIS